MELITIFDTETSGLDTELDSIMELAWGQYSIEKKRFVSIQSSFIKWEREYLVSESAAETTGLSWKFCEEQGDEARYVLTHFTHDVQKSGLICAHNLIGYDRPLTAANLSRALLGFNAREIFEKAKCVDTLLDCPYPKTMKQHSLKYLALDHGYVLTGAHQALNDVMACAHIFSCYDWNTVRQISDTPVITLSKKLDFQDLERRDALKNLRFYWNPNKKVWEKRIRAFYMPQIESQLTFNLDIN